MDLDLRSEASAIFLILELEAVSYSTLALVLEYQFSYLVFRVDGYECISDVKLKLESVSEF